MTRRSERTGQTAEPNINVTPLIDVLLVLLIIFMVVSPSRPHRFKTLIPEPPPESEEVEQSPRTLVVDIGRDSKLRLIKGKDLIAEASVDEPGAVTTRLAREFAERRAKGSWKLGMENRSDISLDERVEKTVFIKAPRTVLYGTVAAVIDGVKGAGAAPIGLQTDELLN
ncbi:MAG TPA: biopolymer transporter ExbD [Pyrinomonadaceae bacterium]|jgi:biopolymer transport protein ExbD